MTAEVLPVVIGACGDTCPGDLHPVIALGAWDAEKCDVCGCSWTYQVPRPVGEIDAAAETEARRRAALRGAS